MTALGTLMLVACVSVPLLVLPTTAHAQSILTCVFPKDASFVKEGPKKPQAQILDGPFEVTFAGLNSNTPRLKAQLGESALRVLKRNADTLWLGEEPSLGGLNVWTVFLRSRLAVVSKQYYAEPLDTHFAIVSMGHCK